MSKYGTMVQRRRRTGRPEGRTEIGATQEDVSRGYEAFCKKHCLPFGRANRWRAKKIGKAVAQ